MADDLVLCQPAAPDTEPTSTCYKDRQEILDPTCDGHKILDILRGVVALLPSYNLYVKVMTGFNWNPKIICS